MNTLFLADLAVDAALIVVFCILMWKAYHS